MNENRENEALRKPRKLTRIALIFSTAAIILTPLVFIGGWWVVGLEELIPAEYYVRDTPPSKGLLAGVLLLNSITPLCLMAVFYWMRRMLLLLNGGRDFHPMQATCIRWAGLLLLARELLSPVIYTLTVLLVSAGNPSGERVLVFTLSFDQEAVLGVMAGVFLILISYVMEEARRLYEENRAIV